MMQIDPETFDELVVEEMRYFGSLFGAFDPIVNTPTEKAKERGEKFMEGILDITERIVTERSLDKVPCDLNQLQELLIARLKFTLAEVEKLYAASNANSGD